MKALQTFWSRICALWPCRAVKQEIDEELRFHIEQRTSENLAVGMSPKGAAREARKRFGNVQRVREECRETRGANFGETLWKDIVFGLRMLRRNPSFSFVVVLTLALGIGATTAIFSVIYGVLISPYPYARPGEIWAPGFRSPSRTQVMHPYRPDGFAALQTLPAFSQVMGTSPDTAVLGGKYSPEVIIAPRLSANAFQFLGVAPILGRGFGPEDVGGRGQSGFVTVISYSLWQRLFGGQPSAIGRTLRLDNKDYTIIGVMPPRFGWWTSNGAWLPLATEPTGTTRIFPVVRLKPGITAAVAQQQLQSLDRELAKADAPEFPNGEFESFLTNYLDMTAASGAMKRSLQVLFGAVVFLLLIACANVANLQLARATVRSREMAIRLSVGAGRFRILRQLLTESILLSVSGGLLGLAFAVAITRLMVMLMPSSYVPNEARIEINAYVLWFCIAISMFTGIVSGLMPAVQSSRPNLNEALKDEDKGSGPVRGKRLRAALVVSEVALSVILLVCAGLTVRSFLALKQIDLGFRPEHVITADVKFPSDRYTTLQQRNQFSRALLESVQRLPGVQSAEIGDGGLPFGGPHSTYTIAGQSPSDSKSMIINLTSAEYLKTMGIRLMRGRMFEEREVQRGDNFVVINHAAAALWPAGEDPIGSQIQFDLMKQLGGAVLGQTNKSGELRVIGVFANTRNEGLLPNSQPAALVPYTLIAPPGRSIAIRATGNPATVIRSLRDSLKSLDPQMPLRNVRAMKDAVADFTVQPRFTMALFSLFAAFGLGLAALGIYSVLSFLVARRTREIGVRMALGAQRLDVLALIFKDGGRLLGLGILIGTLASIGIARFLGSQVDFVNVTPTDPIAFVVVLCLLIVIAAFACWLPARRAARLDPMTALRHE